jgi:hypothetical protein
MESAPRSRSPKVKDLFPKITAFLSAGGSGCAQDFADVHDKPSFRKNVYHGFFRYEFVKIGDFTVTVRQAHRDDRMSC